MLFIGSPTAMHADDSYTEKQIDDSTHLSRLEAERIVRDRMEAKAFLEAEYRSALESMEALAEWVVPKHASSGKATIFRRVAPPPRPLLVEKTNSPRREITEEERAAFLRREAEGKPRLNISLSATVFDGEISEISLWHEGERYKVLSNVPFSYLQVIGSFEDETAEWSYFGMVHQKDAQEEASFAEQAKAFGGNYIPSPRPDKSLFSSMEVPEYLVLAKQDQAIPNAVLTRLDAIHSYYLANEKRLAAQYQRRQALAEARREWQEANPEVPKDTIINFWPIRSNSARISPGKTTQAPLPSE